MHKASPVLIVSLLIGGAGGWLHEALSAKPVPQEHFDLAAIEAVFTLSSQATNAAWEIWETEAPIVAWMQPAITHARAGYPCCRLQRILMAVWFNSSKRVAPAPTEKGDGSKCCPEQTPHRAGEQVGALPYSRIQIKQAMHTVYKYPIGLADNTPVTMPKGAQIIHAGTDPQGTLCVWARVDTEAPKVARDVRVVGTGHPMSASTGSHIGSFQQGPFMWHVFEGK